MNELNFIINDDEKLSGVAIGGNFPGDVLAFDGEFSVDV